MGRVSLIMSAFLLLASSQATRNLSPGLLVSHLRCDYLVNPLGVGDSQPQLSWVLAPADASLRSQQQTAYQVLVASTPEKLRADQGDAWDSGKISSDQTIQVTYSGKPLASKHLFYWKVRVWDEGGRASNWSENAFWSMGLLEKMDWAAKWISDPNAVTTAAAEAETIRGVNSGYRSQLASNPDSQKWVAIDLGEPATVDAVRLFPAYSYDWPPGGPAYFFTLRFKIELANQADFADASVVIDQTQQDVVPPYMNADGSIYRFTPTKARHVRLVLTRLYAENELFAGVALAEMQILSNGKNLARGKQVAASDSVEGPGWSKAYLVDGITQPVRSSGLIQPTAMFRKSFSLNGEIRRATVYATARGLYELRINGHRVGDHVLAPEWTDFTKRIQYQTYDVTSLVQRGDNAIGAFLAAGWYSGHVGLMPSRRIYGSVPQLLVHVDVEFADGRTQSIVSDESWKRTGQSPIVSSDIYDGETYDARKEQPGWDTSKFDDAAWLPVETTPDGAEALVWQRNEPIRAISDLKPISITQTSP
ncbi:MAG: alpha-L-rhamnosidase N-terminal domain-containing protein, partial [Candidatus Acidiferrales bacterium]